MISTPTDGDKGSPMETRHTLVSQTHSYDIFSEKSDRNGKREKKPKHAETLIRTKSRGSELKRQTEPGYSAVSQPN